MIYFEKKGFYNTHNSVWWDLLKTKSYLKKEKNFGDQKPKLESTEPPKTQPGCLTQHWFMQWLHDFCAMRLKETSLSYACHFQTHHFQNCRHETGIDKVISFFKNFVKRSQDKQSCENFESTFECTFTITKECMYYGT